jgi:cupin fold WbuC family metalloprotein
LPVFIDASDLHLLKKSEEVYYAVDEIVSFSQSHVDFLKSNMHNSKTGRIRICAHKSPGDMIHEMLIIIDGKSYMRPHKHVGKPESFHIIEGAIDVVLFDEEGNIVDKIRLASRGSGSDFFYRLSKHQFHTVLINSDHAIIIETTQGPFNKEETIFAPWSPNEYHISASKYFEHLKVLRYKTSSKMHDERNEKG